MVSIILASVAGIGSAFIGNKVYPIQGGAEASVVEEGSSSESESSDEEKLVLKDGTVDDGLARTPLT